jgi:hypothetical protein
MSGLSQQTGRGDARKSGRLLTDIFAIERGSCCSAITALTPIVIRTNKSMQINALHGYDTILTCSDAVSMVRAALEGDGRHFPSTQASFRVSTAWLKARMTAEMELATPRLPMKLRFPQGSEVWITGCPKFETAARSGLTNLELEAGTALPEHRRWHAVSGFLQS